MQNKEWINDTHGGKLLLLQKIMPTHSEATGQQNIHPRQPVNNLKLWWSDLVGATVSIDPEYMASVRHLHDMKYWEGKMFRMLEFI